jgi:hypothetical protein
MLVRPQVTDFLPPGVEVPLTYKDYALPDWLALPEWPSQRNTPAHADKLDNWGGFNRRNPTLGVSVAVIRYRGKEYRADGNSTALLCREGKCHFRSVIHSPVFDVGDDESLGQEVYKSLNEKHSTKTAVDVLVSAVKFNQMAPNSALISRGGVTSGLSIAVNALRGVESNSAPPNIDDAVRAWKSELVWVDTILAGTAEGRIAGSTPVIASMLMSHAKYAVWGTGHEHMVDFWRNFHTARGVGNTQDPWVLAWNYIVLHLSGSRDRVYDMVQYVLGCVEATDIHPKRIRRRPIKTYLID